MHIHAAMKRRRFIFVRLQRSVGLDGETKCFRAKDLTEDILSN